VIGARALMQTLVDSGVDVCFMNPGTSEMHFVHELDAVPQMRGVLALFEGVATGAADGYARMTGRPAAVLLHLGPGLGNGLANLHNARRAHSPVVTIVGAHATYHEHYDAPLQSDIESVARNVSGWYRASAFSREVGRDVAAAVAASLQPPGQVVTLVVPADVSWSQGAVPARPRALPPAQPVDNEAVDQAAAVLTSQEPTLLLLGGVGTREPGLRAASRICAATGAQMLGEVFPARQPRGAGVPPLERLAYLAEAAQKQLQGIQHVVLAGARSPVSFFAYPGRPSDLVPDGASVHTLADGTEDVTATLEALADRVAPGTAPQPRTWPRPRPRPARSMSTPWPRQLAPPCRRTRSSSTRRRPPASACRPPPRTRHATTGSPKPAGRSARACPPHSALRSPPPTGKCCACKPTAAPFTPTRRCGRWPASGPT